MSRQILPRLSVRVRGLEAVTSAETANRGFLVFLDLVPITDEVLWYREGRWQRQNKRTNALITSRSGPTTGTLSLTIKVTRLQKYLPAPSCVEIGSQMVFYFFHLE